MNPVHAFRYYWVTAAGYRFRPWASPYLRWRLETYFGKQADVHGAGEFFRLMWRERKRMSEFLEWVETRQAAQRERAGQ